MKPVALLLQDLLRAHSNFLLHHDSSLSSLFLRVKRTKFTTTIGRYWDLFLSTWNVLLAGNPVRDVFGGIKIAACGELGIGVGEEDRGSGEREVLEGLVGRLDGLVDLVVSKFGTSDPDDFDKSGENKKEAGKHHPAQWLGTGKEPGAEDGAIFLGTGALSRKSVRDITQWVEDMFSWGENAYGVLESPKAARRTMTASTADESPKRRSAVPLDVPPSLFSPKRGRKSVKNTSPPRHSSPPRDGDLGKEEGGDGKGHDYMDYLKLGYGKYWSLGGDSTTAPANAPRHETRHSDPESPDRHPPKGDDTVGHFLIGHTGEIEEGWVDDPEDRRFALEHEATNGRTMVRTLTVELESEATAESESTATKALGSQVNELSSPGARAGRRASFDHQDCNKTKRLRVVVYVAKPFIFVLLYRIRTESLALEGMYRSLHHQLGPLRKLLSRSTSYRPERPDMGKTASAIYDLVWDPKAITVNSTIPNIPDTADMYNSDPPPWSRVEALNTHMQVLNLWKATRSHMSEIERTCKTSRGWWIVWSRILERSVEDAASSSSTMRVSGHSSAPGHDEGADISSTKAAVARPDSDLSLASIHSTVSSTVTGPHEEVSKEIFLIRKASDHAGGHVKSGSFSSVASGAGWADGASRLAQGIGVDTRRYIEGLLSLNR